MSFRVNNSSHLYHGVLLTLGTIAYMHVPIRAYVKNLLSPNYCRHGVKDQLAAGANKLENGYHRRDQDDFCSPGELEREAKLVAEYIRNNCSETRVTVFLLQEVWSQVLYHVAKSLYNTHVNVQQCGTLGTTAVIVHVGACVGNVRVTSLFNYDLSKECRGKSCASSIKAVNNISCASVTVGSTRHLFISGHVPFQRACDETYFYWLYSLVATHIENYAVHLGWDLSTYWAKSKILQEFEKTFDNVLHATEHNPAGGLWTTGICSTWRIVPAEPENMYWRSDHTEFLCVELCSDDES